MSETRSGAQQADRKRRGATAVDYLFCLSLIFLVCLAAVRYVGDMLTKSLSTSTEQIEEKVKN